MDPTEKLAYLYELIETIYPLEHWVYSLSDGHLLTSNSSNERILDVMFSNSRTKTYLMEYAKTEHKPLIISSTLGILWIALFQNTDDAYPKCYIMGPAFSSAISPQELDERVEQYQIPLNWKRQFLDIVKKFPVIPWSILSHYIIMAHYTLTGETITTSDFVYAPTLEDTSKHLSSSKSRKSTKNDQSLGDRKDLTWQAEQALLNNVRYGNLDYKSALRNAIRTSSGVSSNRSDPIRQYQDSAIVFIALCARAAIDGGLSPTLAYRLQNMYSQSITDAQTLSDIASTNHLMYADFIERVHRAGLNADTSPQIAHCIDYIDLHLTEDLDLHTLASALGYSDYYLSRKFKQEMQVGLSEYIRAQRILRAKNELETTGHTIQEISDALHFCSRTYFTECFQKETGMTPSEYRRKYTRFA